jgi:2,5-dioxopentanoate dehydrogenase
MSESQVIFHSTNPATGQQLDASFLAQGAADVERACGLASHAFAHYRETSPSERAAFLERIAQNILDLGDALTDMACAETALPPARITSERGRTVNQLRLFSEVVKGGAWADIRVDYPLPQREPLPRSDIRLRKVGIGPVAVFGASNFPLAFSTAGGDTASALAAGCPVVLKAHPAHPGTSALVASAITDAVKKCGLHDGTFQHLSGPGNELGLAIVKDPRIKAVGFTGSRAGGLALVAAAAARHEPIPVYAEMSSVNPVFLLPGALSERAEALGEAFITSLSMGAGQFCTNPGLIFGVKGVDLSRFEAAAVEALRKTRAATMLSSGIHSAYVAGIERLTASAQVEHLAYGCALDGINQGQGALFATTVETFQQDATLREEVFGASSLIVRCSNIESMVALAHSLEGQLTATLHLNDSDHDIARALLPTLEDRCGRLLVNGWPTGVEVCHAMVHGGPFPATSDSRSTSVGSLAIDRFLRPICYQDFPDALRPAPIQDNNPLHFPWQT